MNWTKWLGLVVAGALVLGLGLGNSAMATDTGKTAGDSAKTIVGKADCGGCSGVVEGCCVMLTDKAGDRWILRGDSKTLKAAFKLRHSGKTMTATLAGKPETKTGKDGKEYKEVQVSAVQVAS